MEDFAISIGDRNEVLILNEYNGNFSIISGYEGRDGNNYFNMVFPKDFKTKQARERAIPQKVTLGYREAAYKILRQFLTALENGDNVARPASKPDDGDIPF